MNTDIRSAVGDTAYLILLIIGNMSPHQRAMFEEGDNKTFMIMSLLRQRGFKISHTEIIKGLIILKQYFANR